jgi:hypothetical protein
MILDSLQVESDKYGPEPDKYKGKVRFKNGTGSVELTLDHEISTEILKLCAAGIVRNTAELAKAITANVIESSGGLIQIGNQNGTAEQETRI